MTIEFKAQRAIAWTRPNGCPAHAETLKVFSGHDEGDLALEVGVAEWTGAESPSRDALAKLHKDRVGQGINPVVILASNGERAWLFGPNSQASVVGPLALDHAQRLLQSALDEPSGLAARRTLNQTYEAIAATSTGGNDSDALRGVGNAGLFATHELRHGVRQRADWTEACQKSKEAMSLRRLELIKKLGYSVEDVGGNASLLKSKGDNARAVAVILLDNETFDGQSNRFAVSPVAFGLQVADRKEVSWLIVIRKDAIRLYPARLDLGVGRKGLAETYFELNLSVADDSTAGFLSLIFSADALAENGSCYEILTSSAQYAVGLGARLRDKVYGEIVPQLSLAVAAQLPKLGVPMDREGLNRAYQITLRIFFRMLFQAYADDRKLLPYGENQDYTNNAIKGFAHKLIGSDIEFDAESCSYWDDLTQVWRAIDTGSKRFGIPAYNGGLFSSDEELQPEGALIEQLRLTDDIIGPVLRALLIDSDDDGTVGPIDFRSLSVREFGTIYEGLLESNLGLADTDLLLDDKDTWIPAPKGAKLIPGRSAKKGTVYFHDTSGARKGTGSYFTPSFVVEHLLERSLDPALDAHLERVREVLESGDQVGAADLFFDFKVADLAMGSAHFLTAAIDHIEQRMAGFLDMHPIPGVTNELRRLEEAAKEKLGENASVPEPSSLLRRQIARRCIYGLDINPVAVELARVSIWIHTFVRGLPMSSLDHTLVCANSLSGIVTVDEALNVLNPDRKKGSKGIFESLIEEALTRARNILVEVGAAAELDSRESKSASLKTVQARREAQEAKRLFDAAVLARIGVGEISIGCDPTVMAQEASRPPALAALEPLKPAHLPHLFPEVFLRERAGFDVLVGNPPWNELHVNADKFWVRYFPGHMSQPDTRKEVLRAEYAVLRPDLAEELKKEQAAADVIRSAVKAVCRATDLYQAFVWRYLDALATDGACGVVLPRGVTIGASLDSWREKALRLGRFAEVFHCVNKAGWMFESVEPRIQIVLLSYQKSGADVRSTEVVAQGIARSEAEFALLRSQKPLALSMEQLTSISSSYFVPAIPRPDLMDAFLKMRSHPSLGDLEGDLKLSVGFDGIARVVREANKAKPFSSGALSVVQGKHLKHWEAASGDEWITFDGSVTLRNRPGIGFRKLARSDDSRTFICSPIPAGAFVKETGYWLISDGGDYEYEVFLLGVLSSRVFDWYVRCLVDRHILPSLAKSFPVPKWEKAAKLHRKVVALVRSSFPETGFSDYGFDGSRINDSSLAPELDGVVAAVYGLSADELQGILETFHPTYDPTSDLPVAISAFKEYQ